MKKSPLKLEFKGFLSFLILHELDHKQLTGEDLAKKIGKRKGSQLTAGTIYPTLKKMRRLKLVKYRRFGRRKVYELMPDGKKELKGMYTVIGNYLTGLGPYLKATKTITKKGKTKK